MEEKIYYLYYIEPDGHWQLLTSGPFWYCQQEKFTIMLEDGSDRSRFQTTDRKMEEKP